MKQIIRLSSFDQYVNKLHDNKIILEITGFNPQKDITFPSAIIQQVNTVMYNSKYQYGVFLEKVNDKWLNSFEKEQDGSFDNKFENNFSEENINKFIENFPHLMRMFHGMENERRIQFVKTHIEAHFWKQRQVEKGLLV